MRRRKTDQTGEEDTVRNRNRNRKSKSGVQTNIERRDETLKDFKVGEIPKDVRSVGMVSLWRIRAVD